GGARRRRPAPAGPPPRRPRAPAGGGRGPRGDRRAQTAHPLARRRRPRIRRAQRRPRSRRDLAPLDPAAKDLGIDRREGAAHFYELLLDGDVASNSGNWQWVAGTGADPRPARTFNPTLQGTRYDPDGDYHR